MAAAATQLQPQLVKESSRSRHKAKPKPKFDIPVEVVPAESPKPSNAWVYRAETEKKATPLPRMTESGPFEMIAEGMILVGFGSVRLMYRAVTAPLRFTGMLRAD